MSSAKPVSYQVRRFVPNHRKAMVFELVRRTPKSTTGTVTDSRVVHQGEPLSAFRQAQNDLLDAAPRPTLAEAQFNAAMAQAVAVAEQTAAAVLVPPTQVIRRVGFYLRMCSCGHAGRANFHNGDEGAAFELIASPTWRCGFCLTSQPNPGKDDATYAAATKKA